MVAAPNDNPFGATYYGATAISEALGEGDWMAPGCGKCWKVTGHSTYNYTGVTSTLVLKLKGTNFCPPSNDAYGKAHSHSDIAAPGFDVLAFSQSHTCPEHEPEEAIGFAACSGWMIDSTNPNEYCDCDLLNDQVLMACCSNFYNLKWDNPTVDYEEVTCPDELQRLHCDYPYATEANIPKTCSNNV
jgi:hypothetical protein